MRRRPRFAQSTIGFEANTMLALFLDHPPLFVASIVRRRLNRCSNPRGAWDLSLARTWPSKSNDCSPTCGRSGAPSSRCFVGGSGSDTVGSIQAAIRVTPTRRLVLSRRGPDSERLVQRKFPDKPLTSREPFARSLFARSGGGSRRGLENGQGSLIGARSAHSERSKGVY
jgi:hypothetical protein